MVSWVNETIAHFAVQCRERMDFLLEETLPVLVRSVGNLGERARHHGDIVADMQSIATTVKRRIIEMAHELPLAVVGEAEETA